MTFLLTLTGIAVTFLLSPGLMYMLGINYATETGSILEKIHVATEILAIAFAASVLISGRIVFRLSSATYFTIIVLILLIVTSQLALMDRQITGVLVTFLTPVLLIYLIGLMDARSKATVKKLVLFILIANSAVGLCELALGHTILPLMAGAKVVHNDVRAIGLVGHPLTSSFLTGMVIVYLVVSQRASFDRLSLIQFGVHVPALIAFGGRVALVTALLTSLYYVLFDSDRTAGSLAVLRRVGFVGSGVLVSLAILLSGLADNTIARFTADGGSAWTRNTALKIVGDLGPYELAFGMSPSEREAILRASGTEFGIEVTWLSWLVDYGALVALALCILLGMLIAILVRGKQRYHWYLTFYFLVCITGSLGLGSKSMLLAWFVIAMLTFGDRAQATTSGGTAATSQAPRADNAVYSR